MAVVGLCAALSTLAIAGRAETQEQSALPVAADPVASHATNDAGRPPSAPTALRAAGYASLPFRELICPVANEDTQTHGPSLAELANGDLLAVWNARKGRGLDTEIRGARRPAGAQAWTAPVVIHDTPNVPDTNPVLYVGRTGTVRVFWAVEEPASFGQDEERLHGRVSEDGGQTWGSAYDLGAPGQLLPRTHPIRLDNGWVLFPLYFDWSASAVTMTSLDDGATWGRLRYILPLLGTQPTLMQRSDGSVFALMRTGMWPRRSWQAVSRNFGKSWGRHRLSKLRNPGSSLDMVRLRSGHVALVFNDSKTDRANLSVALSEDGGATWPYVKAIEQSPGQEHGYPSIIQDRQGLIHVVYSHNQRTSIAHVVVDEDWIMQ